MKRNALGDDSERKRRKLNPSEAIADSITALAEAFREEESRTSFNLSKAIQIFERDWRKKCRTATTQRILESWNESERSALTFVKSSHKMRGLLLYGFAVVDGGLYRRGEVRSPSPDFEEEPTVPNTPRASPGADSEASGAVAEGEAEADSDGEADGDSEAQV